MRLLGKLLRLPPAERRAWITAAILLGAILVGLWLLPLRVARGTLARLGRLRASRERARLSPEEIAWAVRGASRRLPGTTCLAGAMAVETLLARHGYPAPLRVGVAERAAGPLRAHAWVDAGRRARRRRGRELLLRRVLHPLRRAPWRTSLSCSWRATSDGSG